MDHIGIDVHKQERQICILGAEGERFEWPVRTTPERFADISRPRPRASGWRGAWKDWATR
jgi:hypothetical protein